MNSLLDNTPMLPVSSSVFNPDEEYVIKENRKSIPIVTLGFSLLLFSAPFSTGIQFNPTSFTSSSSILSYKNATNDMFDITILHEFVSDLILNSSDLDNEIVDLVNENFWDLI